MDRHKLFEVENQVGELLRDGSPNCVRRANGIMVADFMNLLYFALNLTAPPPKPKHTIADNYPAGGLTSTEPCMFCVDFEQLQEENEKLETKNKKLRKTLKEISEGLTQLSKGVDALKG